MANRPVPLWIKLLILCIAAVLIASFTLFPSLIKTGIAYERGWKAQKDGRHSTAIKEFEQVLKQFPESNSVMARLAVSYFYNERIDECSELLDRIAGKKVTANLSRQVNEIVEELDSIYYESGELRKALELYGQEELENTAFKLEKYLSINKNSVIAIFHLANINFDMGKYDTAEKLYIRAIEFQPEFYSAYLNLAAVYREKGQLSNATDCCNKVLEKNKEHPQVFIALSKIEFEGGNDKVGLEYAKKAYEFDSGDLNIVSNLCLAYHYNKLVDDRDKYFEVLKQNGYYDLAALRYMFDSKPEAR